jgi:triosephosphate isomerase
MVARKAEAAFANDLIPVICVGETLHENREGLSKVVVMNQVEAALSHLTSEEVAKSIIAYEPVWAIGTGEVCKPAEAEKMVGNIRNLVKAIYGDEAAEGLRVLYGGSINSETIKGFAKSAKIDGYLVGSASVDHKEFSAIVKAVEDSIKDTKAQSKK